jgi:hypothetical protein
MVFRIEEAVFDHDRPGLDVIMTSSRLGGSTAFPGHD